MIRIATLLAAGLAGGAIEAPKGGAGVTQAPDVCAMVSGAEAAKVLGGNIRARPEKRSDGAGECRYVRGMGPSVSVVVEPLTRAK